MAIFFKLGTTGKNVYVVEKRLSNYISFQEFESKVIEYDVESFLTTLEPKIANNINKKIERIKEVNEEIKKYFKENKDSGVIERCYSNTHNKEEWVYVIENENFSKSFVCYNGFQPLDHRQRAINYAKEIFGKKLEKEYLKVLEKEPSSASLYIKNNAVVSKEDYEKSVNKLKELFNEMNELTSIVNIKKVAKSSKNQ